MLRSARSCLHCSAPARARSPPASHCPRPHGRVSSTLTPDDKEPILTDSSQRRIASLGEYSLLGRSGLRVSPLCLGTMTFGTEWGFGSDRDTARAIFDHYLAAGGNFLDTADGYTNGRS